MHFADRLQDAIRAKGNPICVGLDPRFDQLPKHIRESAVAIHGKTARAVAEAFLEFNKAIIDAVADIVPVCKPQSAFYEEFGYEGVRVFAETIRYAKSKGLIVIADAKRGDIGATAQAYARAFLGAESIENENVGFDADALTVNPYMGADTLQPYAESGLNAGRGIFVLVKTSNPGSGDLQDLVTDKGKFVRDHVAELVHQMGTKHRGTCGLTDVGAVVGATYPEQARKLRELMPDTVFLIPGYGAQGATAKDAAAGFRGDGGGAIVNNSRGIIFAYKSGPFASHGESGFAGAARAATLKMAEELSAALSKPV